MKFYIFILSVHHRYACTYVQCTECLENTGQTQLTHHSTSGDFPKPLSLLSLPIGAVSSPLSGQQQSAGALGLHLCQRSKQKQLKHSRIHRH